jgi:23S rRNA (cytidine1920-2'-O)/16S rRNA (cytidine1409-2'-O)-methyltransferase
MNRIFYARRMAGKTRIDQLLVSKGFCESREQAQRAIMAGRVLVGGQKADKPSLLVSRDAAIEVRGSERYVGRGGFKLEAALEHFKVPVKGKTCLDVGSSTGGFTDCLLQRGAAKVYAVDVGRGQIDWKLRNDPRVIVREGINARYLSAADIGETVEICVVDVSFISLTLILPAVFALLPSAADMVVLIKPQFELSPGKVGRGGIVRDSSLHVEAIEKIRRSVEEKGKHWLGVIESPLRGREGNVEFLAHIRT